MKTEATSLMISAAWNKYRKLHSADLHGLLRVTEKELDILSEGLIRHGERRQRLVGGPPRPDEEWRDRAISEVDDRFAADFEKAKFLAGRRIALWYLLERRAHDPESVPPEWEQLGGDERLSIHESGLRLAKFPKHVREEFEHRLAKELETVEVRQRMADAVKELIDRGERYEIALFEAAERFGISRSTAARCYSQFYAKGHPES